MAASRGPLFAGARTARLAHARFSRSANPQISCIPADRSVGTTDGGICTSGFSAASAERVVRGLCASQAPAAMTTHSSGAAVAVTGSPIHTAHDGCSYFGRRSRTDAERRARSAHARPVVVHSDGAGGRLADRAICRAVVIEGNGAIGYPEYVVVSFPSSTCQ